MASGARAIAAAFGNKTGDTGLLGRAQQGLAVLGKSLLLLAVRVNKYQLNHQSAYTPAALMTGLHLLISDKTNFLCSWGSVRLSVIMTAPLSCCFLTKAGSLKTLRMAVFHLVWVSALMPLGP
jgi:hypothetical protein